MRNNLMKYNSNFLCILGYAGHGKDTVKSIVEKNFNENEFESLAFANQMKIQTAESIGDVIQEGAGETLLEKLNDLKDNRPDLEIYRGLNARKFLQMLGTEFYREVNVNIHVKFSALKILVEMEKSPETFENKVFVSSDTRFPNELEFFLQVSSAKNKEELKAILKSILAEDAVNMPDKNIFVGSFKDVFKINNFDKRDVLFINRMWKDVEALKNISSNMLPPKVNLLEVSKLSKEEAIRKGIIHVFRPVISMTSNNIISDERSLIQEMSSFLHNENEVAKIQENYNCYNVDFTKENLMRYGFLRADINHPSESSLDGMKPEPIISMPVKDFKMGFDKLEKELIGMLKKNEVKIEPNKVKKKVRSL